MNKVISRSVDKYELEGDVREAYAAWMSDMANTTIVKPTLDNTGITFAGIPVDDAGVFDILPF